MFTLGAGKTLAASGPTAVNFFVFGDGVTTVDAFDILAKGSVSVAATVIYTAPAVTQALIRTLEFFNTAGTPSTIFLYGNGTATTDRFFTATIPAGGTLTYGNAGWQMTDSTGAVVVTASSMTLTGDVTASGLSPLATTISNNVVSNAKLAQGAANTIKANPTNALANEQDVAVGANQFLARTSVSNLAAQAVTDAALAWLALTTVAAETAALNPVTTSLQGMMSALDKQKLDNLWIDVTANPTALVLSGNTAAQNITAINAILAAAPAGATIFFPGGTYSFNAAWTMPAAKQFTFQGKGPGISGGNTLLQWTSNVGGTWITLASSTFYYYFRNLTFISTGVTQTAGAVVDVNGNATTNFYNCHFGGLSGGFLNDVLIGTNTGFGQSWNSSVISDCIMSSYKGRGIFIDSAAASLVVANCVIQGAWGGFTGAPASLQALAGVQANNCGALEINDCDILGNINNLLLSPAVSQVNASCFMTNCYLDNSGGSCFKIAGAGATVRVRFDTCSFTTAGTNYTTPGSGFSAVENAGTFTFAAGGQSIGFTNCNILNTFATAGTTNGVLLAGTWADWYFTNCNDAGWTNGFNVTPSGTNISMLKVGMGAVGPSAGYGANTTGFNIAAGSYKGLMIQAVNAHGNTTNLTLGAVTVAAADASLFRIADNSGINPRGAVTTPTFPASTVAVTNTTGFRVYVGVKGGTSTAVAVNGVAAVLAATPCSVVLDPGGTIAITFSVAPTWVWVGN